MTKSVIEKMATDWADKEYPKKDTPLRFAIYGTAIMGYMQGFKEAYDLLKKED